MNLDLKEKHEVLTPWKFRKGERNKEYFNMKYSKLNEKKFRNIKHILNYRPLPHLKTIWDLIGLQAEVNCSSSEYKVGNHQRKLLFNIYLLLIYLKMAKFLLLNLILLVDWRMNKWKHEEVEQNHP